MITFLILCLGFSLLALCLATSIAVVRAGNTQQVIPNTLMLDTDYYNNVPLKAYPLFGDCWMSPLYHSGHIFGVYPAVVSASPSGWHVLCGYCYPVPGGTPHYYELTSPGYGPSTSAPTYAVLGDNQAFDETVNAKVDFWTDLD